MLRKFAVAALLLTVLSAGGAAQNNAATVLTNASKAMGVDNLMSITYSGTAQNGAFGQAQATAISGVLTRCRSISNGTAASTWRSTRSVSVAAFRRSWDGSSSRSHGGWDAAALASH